MIKSISISNYQSHKKTELELDSGVNIIVGQSDSGKTAILRALRWLIWNKPGGNAFRSEWGGDTSVKIELDSKARIARRKTKTHNTYTLSSSEENKEANAFRAVGQGVPEDIQKALNISDLNVQNQLDAPFLLSETSGEIARKLNKIANIEVIDRAISNINRKSREINTRIKIHEEDLASYRKEKEELAYVEIAEKDIDRILEKQERLENVEQDGHALALLIVSLKQASRSIRALEPIVKAEIELTELIRKQNELEEAIVKADDLLTATLDLKEITKLLKKLKPIVRAEKKVAQCFALLEGIEQRTDQYNNLAHTINELIGSDNELARSKYRLEDIEREFKKKMGKVCPLCNQKIKEQE